MVGPWFTTPWRLVSQTHGAVAWRFRSACPSHVPFPFASSRHRPVPDVPLCGPSHTPFPAPSPCPIMPCLYPTGPPATPWRGPTGSSSIRGPLRAPSTGRSLPASSLSLVPRPRPSPLGRCAAPSHPSSRVYTPPGCQQPCGAGPLDPHPSGDRFVRLARVAPLPPPPLTPVPPPIAHRLGRAPLRPGCSYPGRLFVVFSPLPRTLQSVAPGSPPDDPVRGLGPCSTPPRMLQSGASFCRILSFASDAPVRGTGFTPGRSSPGASAVLHSAPDAPIRGVFLLYSLSVASDAPVRGPWFTPGRTSPVANAVLHSAPVARIRGVFLSYSLRCLGCSSPWHRVHPRTIQSGG